MHDPSHVRVTGPLTPYTDGFREELARLGYTAGSAELQLGLVAHLSRWLADHDLNVGDLNREHARQFLEARRGSGYTAFWSERSLLPLLGYLRRLSVVPEPTPPLASTPLEELLEAYRDYLVHERGLGVSVNPYLAVAGRFLSDRSSGPGLGLESLAAADVTRFVLRECSRGYSVSYAKNLVAALRSLLRYLHVEGLTPIQLAPAVLSVASWRGSALPRALDAEQVTRLLTSCDRQRATGRRDFALLLLLVRMGLRAGEVAALEFEDIDWRLGELTIRGKGNRHERLPLPVDVGEAMVDYLRHGRPQHHECARLFMRAQAPYAGLTSTGVTAVVYLACDRAGLPQVGAHRLRHTAATEMLSAGAKLSEVGQVLRHQGLATTAIYAKVDRATLRPLARPWPGGAA
jgi:site-specific recombinase XerD